MYKVSTLENQRAKRTDATCRRNSTVGDPEVESSVLSTYKGIVF